MMEELSVNAPKRADNAVITTTHQRNFGAIKLGRTQQYSVVVSTSTTFVILNHVHACRLGPLA
jgi:hypothetical protein